MNQKLRTEIDCHQTADDHQRQWAQGAFNDGVFARITGHSRNHAPSEDVIGRYSRDSWLAGWSDADMGIIADGLLEKMPVNK